MTVQTLLERISSRLVALGKSPEIDIMEAINALTAVVAQRLAYRDSDLARKLFAPFAFAAGASASLPTDFRGLAEDPFYISGGTRRTLSPVRDRSEYAGKTSPTPQYYEVMGAALYLYPAATAELALQGAYYFCPADVTLLTSTLPYAGTLDPIYSEFVPRVMLEGYALLGLGLETLIDQRLDSLLQRRQVRNRRASGYHY